MSQPTMPSRPPGEAPAHDHLEEPAPAEEERTEEEERLALARLERRQAWLMRQYRGQILAYLWGLSNQKPAASRPKGSHMTTQQTSLIHVYRTEHDNGRSSWSAAWMTASGWKNTPGYRTPGRARIAAAAAGAEEEALAPLPSYYIERINWMARWDMDQVIHLSDPGRQLDLERSIARRLAADPRLRCRVATGDCTYCLLPLSEEAAHG